MQPLKMKNFSTIISTTLLLLSMCFGPPKIYLIYPWGLAWGSDVVTADGDPHLKCAPSNHPKTKVQQPSPCQGVGSLTIFFSVVLITGFLGICCRWPQQEHPPSNHAQTQ